MSIQFQCGKKSVTAATETDRLLYELILYNRSLIAVRRFFAEHPDANANAVYRVGHIMDQSALQFAVSLQENGIADFLVSKGAQPNVSINDFICIRDNVSGEWNLSFNATFSSFP